MVERNRRVCLRLSFHQGLAWTIPAWTCSRDAIRNHEIKFWRSLQGRVTPTRIGERKHSSRNSRSPRPNHGVMTHTALPIMGREGKTRLLFAFSRRLRSRRYVLLHG